MFTQFIICPNCGVSIVCDHADETGKAFYCSRYRTHSVNSPKHNCITSWVDLLYVAEMIDLLHADNVEEFQIKVNHYWETNKLNFIMDDF